MVDARAQRHAVKVEVQRRRCGFLFPIQILVFLPQGWSHGTCAQGPSPSSRAWTVADHRDLTSHPHTVGHYLLVTAQPRGELRRREQWSCHREPLALTRLGPPHRSCPHIRRRDPTAARRCDPQSREGAVHGCTIPLTAPCLQDAPTGVRGLAPGALRILHLPKPGRVLLVR